MTTETLAEAIGDGDPAGSGAFAPSGGNAVHSHLLVSIVFLVLSLLAGLILAIQLVVPEFMAGIPAFSYGRLQPLATHLFVYGWLTLGLIGAIYHIVSQVARTDLFKENQAVMALGLLTVGYFSGGVAIAMGFSEGRRLLEAPIWADAIVLLGLLGFARVITRMARRSSELIPVQWYAAAAAWWLVLLHLAGNIPGLGGIGSAMQISFYRSGFTGLWIAAAGVGVVYYAIPRLTGRDAFVPTQLSVIGLWSLAFFWVLTAPADLTYGPTPDWLDTVSVIFAIGMVIPVIVIFTDIVLAMRSRWDTVTDATAMRYVMAGAVAFALLPLVNLVLALRSSSAVVGFTNWIVGYEFLAFGAMASFWLVGYAVVSGPDMGRGPTCGNRWHYRVTLLGAVVVAGSLFLSGAQAGLTWLGSANSAAFLNVGDGFRNTVLGLDAMYVWHLVGYAIYAVGLLWFTAGIFSGLRSIPEKTIFYDGEEVSEEAESANAGQSDPPKLDPSLLQVRALSLSHLARNVLVLFGLAVLLVWILPSLESDLSEPTLLADRHRVYDDGLRSEGRKIYLREGCQVCHTQAVRPIVTDVGLGAVSVGGDYVHEVPALIGFQRIGPDLMHVGRRLSDVAAADLAGVDADPSDFADEAREQAAIFIASHLRNPRQARPWSIMPSYDYLRDSDIDALVAYIAALE